MEQKRDVICLENVSKSYKIYPDKKTTFRERIIRGKNKFVRYQVLKDINIKIQSGEVVGLIGENGSGKSTALKLISRIIYPDEGIVKVEGRVSSLIELGAGFHQDLSGRENIYTNAAIFGLTKNEIESRINDIIDFSELWDFIDNPVRTYSSGMYTRLAFSVAINVDADILLIDEILSVGDKNFQKKCFDWLEELKRRGVTIIIVTHDTSSVENLCTRAIWINEGKVAADGSPQKVVNDYYEYMYEKKFAIEKRLAEERKKAEAQKKDFTREDIIELYRKYLLRDPESEDTINNYYEYFDRKKDIEHTLKYSIERYAILESEKIENSNTDELSKDDSSKQSGISAEDVVNVYRKYLDRDPENEKIIEHCQNAFNNVDDLIMMVTQSPEYKMVIHQKKEMEKNRDTALGVAIEEIEFLTFAGKHEEKLICGKSYHLAIRYCTEQKYNELAFGIEIRSANGYLCFSHNTLNSNLDLGKDAGKHSIYLKFPVLFLYPGRYRLFAYLIDKNGNALNYTRRVYEFEIEGICASSKTCTWSTELDNSKELKMETEKHFDNAFY